MRFLLAIAVATVALAGCSPRSPEASIKAASAPAAPIDPWMLTTLDAKATEPALLWNGLIGVRIGRDGTGTRQPFFAIDEYDTKGEEKIRTLDNPLAASFKVGTETLDPTKGTGYEQSLDMGTGILKTKWQQTLGGKQLDVEVHTVIHPSQRILADHWTFTSKDAIEIDGEIKAYGKVKGSTQPVYEDLKVETESTPSARPVSTSYHSSGGVGKVRTSISISGDTIAFHGSVGDSRPATFQRVMSFGTSPNYMAMTNPIGAGVGDVGERTMMPVAVPKFDSLITDSATIWQDRWKTDIEIDGPKEDQQAVRSFLFYLRSAIHPDGNMSVSPMALSNQQYNGHIFWDADVWVFPALAFVDPKAAAEIPEYRASKMTQARTNFDLWLNADRPTSGGKLGPMATGRPPLGLMYPWESSVTGKETVPGPSQFQHHITGDVAFAAEHATRLGLIDDLVSGSIKQGAAGFFMSRTVDDQIKDVMSPDESHTGDNDLYTNLLAEWCVNGGRFDLSRGKGQTGIHFLPKLPRDDMTFLTYDNDTLRSYKQAAAVLSIYPLQYPPAEKEAKAMMDRFADKVIENGPAMSDSIHAIIWSRLGEKEKAYNTWREGWIPFTRQPLMLFSEKRKKAVTYFTTGAAGCLQTVIYGFLGFRFDADKTPDANWSTRLKGTGSWLNIKPNLPAQWKSVTFKGIKILKRSYTLTATHETVRMEDGN